MIKNYGPINVLNMVDLEVRTGEVHALLGSNGAGKSTLIKILGGLVDATGGVISLDGQEINIRSPRRSLEAGIAIVHQETDLVPELSVSENIYLGIERTVVGGKGSPLLSRIDRAALHAAASDLMRRYGLDIDVGARVADLAPSAQQIVQIARVLALNSQVVIFDEPTARLGPSDRDKLFRIFSILRNEGRKLIFVTHYLDEVTLVADRATIMRDGRVVSTLDVKDTSVKEISRLMVGDDVRSPTRSRGKADKEIVVNIDSITDGANFRDVSLKIRRGEIVGLLGHLGSGRHELSRYIARTQAEGRAGARRCVGFVPEDRRAEGIFPQLALSENVGVGLLVGRSMFSLTPRKDMKGRTQDYIRDLQIKANGSDQIISTLSGGNQQKGIFARALITDPELYVIECPTVGVDVKAGAELHAAIFALAERGAAVLLATDDLDEAIRLSDRIVVMRKGRISQELLPQDYSRQALVVAMGSS
jgi:ABC-type sugar transport system ATPase subunit